MKKLLFLVVLSLSIFTLSACGSDKPLTVLGLDMVEETVYYGEVTIGVNLKDSTYTEAELLEISNAIASQTYLKYADEIGQTKTTLRVNLYDSLDAFTAQNISNGYVIYQINESNTAPGLGSKDVHILVIG